MSKPTIKVKRHTYNATLARARRISKVQRVGGSTQHTRHGGDIEAEEAATDGCEATNGVDVVESLHDAWNQAIRQSMLKRGLGLEKDEVLWKERKEGSCLARDRSR